MMIQAIIVKLSLILQFLPMPMDRSVFMLLQCSSFLLPHSLSYSREDAWNQLTVYTAKNKSRNNWDGYFNHIMISVIQLH